MSEKTSGKSLARNAAFSVIYRLMNILFPLISYGYVARILTAEGVGRHAAASNNVSYFVILGSLGIQAYATREIARRRDDQKARDKFFSEMLIINGILTTVALTAFFICWLSLPLFKKESMMYLICSALVLANYFNVDWYFQGMEEFKFVAVRSFIVKVMSLLAVFLFIRTTDDLYVYAVICMIANAGNHILNVIRACRKTKFSFRGVDLTQHLKPLAFLALCAVSTELYARMDISMLDVMDSSSTVAYYSSVQKIITMITVTVIAITAAFMPRLSYYYTKDKAEFNRLTKLGTETMIFLSLPMCLGLISVAYPLISVWLGAEYLAAVPCLMVVALMIPLKCIGEIVCFQVMMCAGKESYLMVSYMITLGVNFVMNLILIPRYSAFGASVASLISEILVFVIVFLASRKYQNYMLEKKNILVVLLASAAMCAAVLGLGYFVESEWVQLLGGVTLGAGAFAVLNLIFKNTFLINVWKTRHNKA